MTVEAKQRYADLEYGTEQKVSQGEQPFSPRSAISPPSKVYSCKKRQSSLEDFIAIPSMRKNRTFTKACRKNLSTLAKEASWTSQRRPSSHEAVSILTPSVNLCAMAIVSSRNPLIVSQNTLRDVITACSTNFFRAILVRNEAFVNLLFWLAVSVPESWPLWLRRLASRVYVYGAVHASCASAAIIWYILSAIITVREHATKEDLEVTGIVIIWITLCLFLLVAFAAHPLITRITHNTFKQIHRLAGWSVIILFWIQVVLFEREVGISAQTAIQQTILSSIPFWTLLLTTVLVAYPWTRIRLRTIYPEKLSGHAIRLHFNYRISPVLGTWIKISRNPLTEWHPFAIVPNLQETNGFSILVSKAGDWTNDLVDDPTLAIWVRETPIWGVLRVSTLFRPVVVLVTGSGIAPCPSLSKRQTGHPCYIIWSTREPGETLETVDPRVIIISTSRARRPDLMKEAYTRYVEVSAEAVIVLSNRKVTEKTVAGLKNFDVPTNASVFDS